MAGAYVVEGAEGYARFARIVRDDGLSVNERAVRGWSANDQFVADRAGHKARASFVASGWRLGLGGYVLA